MISERLVRILKRNSFRGKVAEWLNQTSDTSPPGIKLMHRYGAPISLLPVVSRVYISGTGIVVLLRMSRIVAA